MADSSNFNTRGGNATLGQNIGVGTCVFSGKEGDTLQFKTLCSSGSTVILNEDSNQVNIETQDFIRADIADIKTGGNLTFNDNIQARFGTDNDMCIVHDGTNTNICYSGTTGDLIIGSSNDILLKNNVNSMFTARDNGSVSLYYDNVVKVKTLTDGA